METGELKEFYNSNLTVMDDPNILCEESKTRELCCRTVVLTDSPKDLSFSQTMKYFWSNYGSVSGIQSTYACIYETPEVYIGLPTIASMALCQELQLYSEPDKAVWRGLFCPTYERKILFSQEIKLRTADLPRWKPKVIIDRRTFDRSDE